MPSNSNDQNQAVDGAYKLTVRFGDEILQAGFTTVPNLLLRYQAELEISSAELNFILQVWYHWWDQKDPYPSLGAIGDRMASSRRQVRRYSESLRLKGYLVVRERKAQGLGQVTSEYDFSSLLERLRQLYRGEQGGEDKPQRINVTRPPRTNMTEGGRTKMTEAPRTRMTPEEYSVQEYSVKKDPVSSNGIISFLDKPPISRISKKSISKNQRAAQTADLPDPDLTRARGASKSFSSVGALISQRQALQLAQVDGSSVTAELAPRRKGRPPKATPWIEQLITDFSGELHDEEHVAQNISQAARLWKGSRHSESSFAQLLYEARAITKQYNVKKRAQGPAGTLGMRNKMPYYFSVLKDLLGLKEPRDKSAFDQPGAPPG